MQTADWKFLLDLTAELGELPPDLDTRWHHYVVRMSQIMRPVCVLEGEAARNERLIDPVLFGYDEDLHDELSGELPDITKRTRLGFSLHRNSHMGELRLRHERQAFEQVLSGSRQSTTRAMFGIEQTLCGTVWGRNGAAHSVIFVREPRSAAFSRRESELLQLANEHAVRRLMLDCEVPVSPMGKLPPRLRTVAERLLAGDSSKQAARHLGLSVHTVVQYTKLLHRELKVSSRTELLLALMGRRQPAADGLGRQEEDELRVFKLPGGEGRA